jgi:hypothetical protein
VKINLGGSGCTRAKQCGACQGDCDRDTDCKGGLKCWQRNNKVAAHGCKSGGKGDVNTYDYCYSPSAMHSKGVSGCTTKSKCSKCQGDCDRDTDCQKGLKCFQRNDSKLVPGCKGGTVLDVRSWDYCYLASDNTALQYLGGAGCTTKKKCSACQGDCDRDADCKTNLQCFQRNDATIIHGCKAGGSGDRRTWDYCFNPTQKVHYGINGCTAKKKCGQCAGDCDRDTDCKPGLKCWQRNSNVATHGCKAGGKGDVGTWDYCYSPSAMHSKGVSGCTTKSKCSKCQGDCDRDTDCQTGLKCFQRNTLTAVPGCKSGTVMDVRSWDYCYSLGSLVSMRQAGSSRDHCDRLALVARRKGCLLPALARDQQKGCTLGCIPLSATGWLQSRDGKAARCRHRRATSKGSQTATQICDPNLRPKSEFCDPDLRSKSATQI